MKNIKYIILLAAVSLIGCTSEFLDTVKPGEQTTGSFYSTDDDMETAVNAIYAPLWEYHYDWARIDFSSYPTDEAIRREPNGLNDYSINSSHYLFTYNYRYNYRGILFANELINAADGVEIPGVEDKDLQARVVGEAKFLRAYYYYDLVKNYGDVPLVTEALQLDEMDQSRSSAKDVYAQIEKDLIEAAAILPTKEDFQALGEVGRATKGAAYGLLTKVCVSQASSGYSSQSFYDNSKWSDAKTYAEELFKLGYSLEADYAKIFAEEGENGSGSIFEVQMYDSPFDDGAYTNNGNFSIFLNNAWFGGVDPYGEFQVTYQSYLAFEESDPRRSVAVLSTKEYADKWYGYGPDNMPEGETEFIEVQGDATGFVTGKTFINEEDYWATGNSRNQAANARIIRLADIYLLYAEASYHLGDEATALTYLNKLRDRARDYGSVDVADFPVVSATGSDLLDAIYLERQRELCFEGVRLHDLIRTGRLEEVVKEDGYLVAGETTRTYLGDGSYSYSVSEVADQELFHATAADIEKHVVWPIPQTEVDQNTNIDQNDNW